MNILMFSEDQDIFVEGSAVRERLKRYATVFSRLCIIAPTADRDARGGGTETFSFFPAYGGVLSGRIRMWALGISVLRREKFDVISVQAPDEVGLIGFLLARRYGVPFQLQIHTDIFGKKWRRSSWKACVRNLIARLLIPRADCIRVVSARIGDALIRQCDIPKSRITVLPVFVDVAAIASAAPALDLHKKYPFDFIILMVSRLSREKNIFLALRAFFEFVKEFPKSGLIIVGDGPERKNLEFRIQNLELTQNVRLEGWQDDLISYYKTADLYLLTSDFEGYARSVVEAVSAGCPVVMTDVGVAGDIVRDGETGRVVKPGDMAALVAALRDALVRHGETRKMAEEAEREVRQGAVDWDEYLRRYQESFASCVLH